MKNDSKIQVLHLEAATTYGGSVSCLERYLKDIGKRASGRDKVIFYNKFQGQERIATDCGVEIQTIIHKDIKESDGCRQSLSARVYQKIKIFICLLKAIKKADVVHLNNGTRVHWIAVLLARFMNKPIVVHLRSFYKDTLRSKICFKMLPDDAVVLPVSHAVMNSYCESALPVADYQVVYDGVQCRPDIERDESLRKSLLKERQYLVGFVGRLVGWKGVETFIRSALEVVLEMPNIRFVVIGGEDSFEKGFRRHLEEIAEPAGDSIFFVGEIEDDIDRYMSVLDVLVLPSLEPEPFGMVILEAMSLRVPVISVNHGGPLEIIEDVENGLFFNPHDHSNLSEAVIKLISDEKLREKLADNAFNTLRDRFDIHETCRQYDYWFNYSHKKKQQQGGTYAHISSDSNLQ